MPHILPEAKAMRRPMNRWIHAMFAVIALAIIVGLFVFWPTPDLLTPPVGQPTPPGASGPTTVPEPTDPGPTALPCPEPGPPGQLSVLTFNIHGAIGPTYDLERIAQEIEAWDADVVLLQEVDRHRERTNFDDQPTRLAVRLGMFVVYGRNVVRAAPPNGNRQQEYGTAILSQGPIRNWSNELLPNYPGLEQRGLLRATVRVAGQWVDIYNTHLQHTRGNIRIVQMRAIRELSAGNPLPQILGGDLNATPDSPVLRIATNFLQDPWPVVGVGPGLTVPPRVPRRRIDYVLHEPAFIPTSAQVFQSAVSDHRAVRVTFELQRPSTCG